MGMQITVQVGEKHYAVDSDHLPPVGTKVTAHKHLYDGGTYPVLEVSEHEWRLEEAPEVDGNPVFFVTIKTRIVNG